MTDDKEINSSLKRTLREHNVKYYDADRTQIQCNSCGQIWSPNIQEGGKLPNGFWKCPKGCNQ